MAQINSDGCSWGHRGCPGHALAPLLYGFPSRDDPKAGRCACGEIGWLWELPMDGRFYCKNCIRTVLRIATYPRSIRFPDEVT